MLPSSLLIKTTPIHKNPTLHIENYSELWYSTQSYFQHDLYNQIFSKTPQSILVYDKSKSDISSTYDDVHDEWFIHSEYNHLSTLTFYEFFLEHKIDIPFCFKNSYSLLRPQRELPVGSFISYFMRHGLKLKTQVTFIKSLHNFFSTHISPQHITALISWKEVFLSLQNLFYSNKHLYNTASPYYNQALSYNHYLNTSSKNISTSTDMFNLLYKNLTELLPLFSFYIYKVDKKIFKNTRGKSGKFTFIWKFIAPYKRLNWVMYWLSKGIKLKTGKNFNSRFQTLFHDIIFKPQNTWVSKIKKFSYNYVYRNCRSTLAETYRTSTK